MHRTVVMIMAGGKGSRLGPLTCHRAKPAVPFAGRYRIIDFVLSNFVNAGYGRIYVLTQYMASSLIMHMNRAWNIQAPSMSIEVVPAQMRMGEHWYRGTADSIYQNLNLIRDARAQLVAVFGGDHIYTFNIRNMEEQHLERSADLTIAAFPVPRAEAHQFGVIQIDEDGRVIGFQEKPAEPSPIPGRPEECLVSMGNYFFTASALETALAAEIANPESALDFGKDVIPRMVAEGKRVFIYDFGQDQIPEADPSEKPYWRDVGTVDSYVQANMDVIRPVPAVNLYNDSWRIRTRPRHYPPARFVREGFRRAPELVDSLVCEGSLLVSCVIERSMIGYDTYIHSGSHLSESILLSGCNIGAGARLHKVLFDKNVSVDPGVVIGLDPEADRERFPFRSEAGYVILPKGTHVPRRGPLVLAHDMEFMLRNDTNLGVQLAPYAGRYLRAEIDHHSFLRAAPRYARYGRTEP